MKKNKRTNSIKPKKRLHPLEQKELKRVLDLQEIDACRGFLGRL